MSKMKPFIRSICFLLGLVLLISACDYLFAQSGYIRYILHEVNSKDSNYDTIILGASHCRSAIDPQKIDDQLGTNTLNLGIPSETIKDSSYLLQESCRNNDVKRVILDVDYQYWVNPQGEGYFSEPFIYNQMSWTSPVKWKYLWDNKSKLDIRSAFTKRNVYLCSPSGVKNNIEFKNSEGYKNYDIYSLNVPDANGPYVGKGFFSRVTSGGQPGGKAYIDSWIGKENAGISDLVLEQFLKIKEYCDNNNIELICVTSPITPSAMKVLGMDVVHDKFVSLFKEYGVEYYDFNMARMKTLSRQDKDFGDLEGHAGGSFGQKYSCVLASLLKDREDNTLDTNKYFYSSFSEMYQKMNQDLSEAEAE